MNFYCFHLLSCMYRVYTRIVTSFVKKAWNIQKLQFTLYSTIIRFRILYFTDAFATRRKANIRIVMSVRLYGKTRLPLYGFSKNFIFENFWKSVQEIQLSLKRYKTIDIKHEYLCACMITSRWIILRMMFRTKIKGKSKHKIIFSEGRALFEIMWKNYGTARHATEKYS